jgi:hypothetical protein
VVVERKKFTVHSCILWLSLSQSRASRSDELCQLAGEELHNKTSMQHIATSIVLNLDEGTSPHTLLVHVLNKLWVHASSKTSGLTLFRAWLLACNLGHEHAGRRRNACMWWQSMTRQFFIKKRRSMHGVKSGQERHPMMLPKMALFFPKLGQSSSTINQQKKICVVRYDRRYQ